MLPSSMLRKLEQLCASHESGEFIATWEDSTLHVHLHHGLVAWVAEEPSQPERTRALLRTLQLNRPTFEEVVDECRRTQSSLGTVIERLGLATLDQIADAFFTHMRDSLSPLIGNTRPGVHAFVRRSSSTDAYDERLAFRLESLMPESVRRTMPLPNTRSMPALFRALVPSLTQSYLAPKSPLPPCPADFTVLRSTDALRVGVELVRDEWIWLEGPASMLLAPVIHAVTGNIRSPLLARRRVSVGEVEVREAPTFEVLAARYSELLAIATQGPAGPEGISRDAVAMRAVACAVLAGFPEGCTEALLGVGDHWVFGKQVAESPVWFAIARSVPQAIGWNMLRSVGAL